MPKRGERSTHRVRFRWSNGVAGTIPCYRAGQAADEVATLRRNAEARDLEVDITVEVRDPSGAWRAVDNSCG